MNECPHDKCQTPLILFSKFLIKHNIFSRSLFSFLVCAEEKPYSFSSLFYLFFFPICIVFLLFLFYSVTLYFSYSLFLSEKNQLICSLAYTGPD